MYIYKQDLWYIYSYMHIVPRSKYLGHLLLRCTCDSNDGLTSMIHKDTTGNRATANNWNRCFFHNHEIIRS